MEPPAIARLEKLVAAYSAEIERWRDRALRAEDERDQYADRLEHEQREHETTKGYRAHAEAQLAAAETELAGLASAWAEAIQARAGNVPAGEGKPAAEVFDRLAACRRGDR